MDFNQNEVTETLLEYASECGWDIEDLNDNPAGARVRGPNLKASYRYGTQVLYDFTRSGLARQIALVIFDNGGGFTADSGLLSPPDRQPGEGE